MLRDLSCPTCGGPGLEIHQPDGVVLCKFCGNKFAEDDSVACPRCEALQPPAAGFCRECGEKLKRTCPACGAANWAGADHCARCGRDLDAIEAMADRHAQGFRGTLQQQRNLANLLKAEEEADSQKRLAAMWGTEAQRQAELARQQTRQREQENTLLVVVLGVTAALACSVIAVTMLILAR